MAKGKGKDASGAATNIPDGGVSVDTSNNVGTDSGSRLEEGAFAGLRQKIEQRLKDQNAAKEQKTKKKAKGGSNYATKDDKKETTSKPGPAQKPKNDNNKDNNNKGKKRDRNGDVIMSEVKPGLKGNSSKSTGDDETDALRKEILALGGTEEDLDLVAGVGSESEVEDNADTKMKSSKKSSEDALRKELSGMLAAAGQVVPDDIEDEEEEAEGEDDNKEDGDDESDEQEHGAAQELPNVEQETSPEPSKENNKKERPKREEFVVPKEYSKLVRMIPMPLFNYGN